MEVLFADFVKMSTNELFSHNVVLMTFVSRDQYTGEVKRYDSPKTLYQRILDSPDMFDEIKKKLADLFQTLNPFILRKAMEKKLKKIFPLYHKNS